MAQQAKQLEPESTSPFDKFRDLTKKLLNVRKDELQEKLEKARREKGQEKPIGSK